MLIEQALLVYKQKMISVLDNYKGMEQNERQVVIDFQMSIATDARPDDCRQALEALKDDGLARKRLDVMRGWVWRITAAGRDAARDLDYSRI